MAKEETLAADMDDLRQVLRVKRTFGSLSALSGGKGLSYSGQRWGNIFC